MLKEGKFIKEPPIRIGAYYVPQPLRSISPEDEFVQDLILASDYDNKGVASTRAAKIVDWILFVLLAWLCVGILVPVLKFVADYLVR
jgi:hypothetical protein